MRTLLLLFASVLCLLGCATPQEQAARKQAEMDRMIGAFGPACYRLGYPANSDAWRNCVVQLAARNDGGTGVSTSFFGSWGNFGRWGRGSGVGAGVTVGR